MTPDHPSWIGRRPPLQLPSTEAAPRPRPPLRVRSPPRWCGGAPHPHHQPSAPRPSPLETLPPLPQASLLGLADTMARQWARCTDPLAPALLLACFWSPASATVPASAASADLVPNGEPTTRQIERKHKRAHLSRHTSKRAIISRFSIFFHYMLNADARQLFQFRFHGPPCITNRPL